MAGSCLALFDGLLIRFCGPTPPISSGAPAVSARGGNDLNGPATREDLLLPRGG